VKVVQPFLPTRAREELPFTGGDFTTMMLFAGMSTAAGVSCGGSDGRACRVGCRNEKRLRVSTAHWGRLQWRPRIARSTPCREIGS